MSSFRLPALYPIVNVAGDDAAECERAFALATELAEAGCSVLQLRAKTLGAGAMTSLARRMIEALRDSGTLLLVNDRADVALASGAAGVHVGDEDLPVEAVRRVVGADAIVGFSTHSVEEAARASSCGADYLGFGPVFDSPTKAGVRDARGLELLARACASTTLPVVAIGGVAIETAADCWRAGAASVAVISEIERSTDRCGLVAKYLAAARQTGRD
jgi:thiamine-phosphate pyrophosphorylase